MAQTDLRKELDRLLNLRTALDDQDALIMENKDQHLPGPLIDIVQALYDEAREAVVGISNPFKVSAYFLDLRTQIRYARSKLEHRVREIEREIEASPPSPITSEVHQPLNSSADPRKVFVVYGRNDAANKALFHFLRAIDLDPMEWNEAVALTGSGSPYPGDVLQVAMARCQAVIVFLTADDLARLGTCFLKDSDQKHERELTPQCRPNVLFEAGMAFALYPKRTIMVALAQTRPFSDTLGRHIVYISKSPESRHELANRLRTARCAVKTDNRSSWLSEGDFEGANHPPDCAEALEGSPTATAHQIRTPIKGKEAPLSVAKTDVKGALTVDEKPFQWDAECKQIVFKYTERFSIIVQWHESNLIRGLIISAANDSPEYIASVVVEIAEANSWNEAHQTFLPNRSFNRIPLLHEKDLPPIQKAKPHWLVKSTATDEHLALGSGQNQIVWPNNDPTTVEIWRLTLGVAYDQLLNLRGTPTGLTPAYLLIRWDCLSGAIAMLKYEGPV